MTGAICTVTLIYFVYFGKYLQSLEMTNTWSDRKNNQLIDNMGLVILIASRYLKKARGLDIDDLIQEGRIALYRAIETFDPSRKAKFSTYAYNVIQRSIINIVVKHNRENWKNVPEELVPIVPDTKEETKLIMLDQIASLFKSAGLTDREQKVIELRYWQDLYFDEIGREIGSSVTNTRYIFNKALKKMQNELGLTSSCKYVNVKGHIRR